MKLLQTKGVAYVVQAVEEGDEETREPYLKDFQGVLNEYAGVFDTPRGLTPPKECDHKILFMNPQVSVNSRPYRYPLYQKNEIERQIKKMFDAGIK